MKQGEHKEYYEDGVLYTTSNYINDQLYGERKVYYQNGKICYIENHVNEKTMLIRL